MSQPDDDPLIGTVLADRYRIEKCLGQGGMGAVYLAEHVRMHKPFAVKLLHPEMGDLAEAVFRFQREAIAAGRVDHEHLVTATDFGELPDGSMYLVLEYVPGKSLAALLAEGPIPTVRALKIARQIAAGLSAVHAAGVFHRDLKPDNVMLAERPGSDEDFVKLLDFGMAKVQMEHMTEEAQQVTRAGLVFGTPRYMAPEQAGGEPTDHRSDIYSLGIVLYAMLAGTPPFSAEEIRDVLRMQRYEPPPPLPSDIDPAVAAFVMTLLAKDPKERIQTADGVIEYIGRLLGRLTAPPAAAKPGLFETLHGRGPIVAFATAVGLLVFLFTFFVVRAVRPRHAAISTPSPSASAIASALVAQQSPSAAPQVSAVEALLVHAEVGDAAAWHELEARPDASRSAREWFVLGVARVTHNAVARGLDAYLQAMDHDARYVDHPRILRDVALAAHSDVWESALRVAAAMPGPAGADILFDVWASTPKATSLTQRARQLLAADAVRARASDAERIAFDLRSVQGESCEIRKPLVARAVTTADSRSWRPLAILAARTGCGHRGKHDCFPCLRDDSSLDRALEQAKDHPAPDYLRIAAAR